jgi:prolipoprotein diacylglyceryltransferase
VTAVVTLAFDPTVAVGPFVVRWETLALAAALFVALVAFAAFARLGARGTSGSRLRLDDLFFLAMAAVPGAIVGGRAVIALVHVDYYSVHPGALVDPSQGSLSLLGAVLGGTVTAAYMARLLEVPARRWLDAAAVPLLVAIGFGKLGYVLGGGGQGLPWDGPWALAFAGPGPWLSPAPSVPAHPSQVYEGAWNLLGAVLVLVFWLRQRRQLAARGGGDGRDGHAFQSEPPAGGEPAARAVPVARAESATRGEPAARADPAASAPTPEPARASPPAVVSRSAGAPPVWSILQASASMASQVPAPDEAVAAGPGFGSVYVAALAWFMLGRVLVGFTWADAPVVAGLNAGQVAALAVLALLIVVGAARVVVGRHRTR